MAGTLNQEYEKYRPEMLASAKATVLYNEDSVGPLREIPEVIQTYQQLTDRLASAIDNLGLVLKPISNYTREEKCEVMTSKSYTTEVSQTINETNFKLKACIDKLVQLAIMTEL